MVERKTKNPLSNSCTTLLLIALSVAVLSSVAGCSKKAADNRQRYHLEGKVVSVSLQEGTATIDHKDIPGFMDAMTMPYAAENPKDLEKLAAGDEITADIVIDNGVPLLANITITKKGAGGPGAAKP